MFNSEKVIHNILGKTNKKLKRYVDMNYKIDCFKCGEKVKRKDTYLWYAFDQDNYVCEECAKKLKHHETAHCGQNVYETNIRMSR